MAPLADEMRPQSFDEVVGQKHLMGPKGSITLLLKARRPLSLLLWGPPGSGKTSIAQLYAKSFNMRFEPLSAVFSGVADIKNLVKQLDQTLFQKGVVLFIDEIHRFNKAQQDALLPWVEKGTITLIGATAENPSFYLNPALLSRLRVLKLEPLSDDDLEELLQKVERKIDKTLLLEKESRTLLIQAAHGDGRHLLNLVENLLEVPPESPLNPEELKPYLQIRSPLYDKQGEQHYDLISALHKSVRASDPNASLYWLCRMLKGGEDPLFLARRLIRMASEDVGLADPQALTLCMAARDAYEMLGSPEGELALVQAVIYLALAPKSNAIYTAYQEAMAKAEETTEIAPPLHSRNAPTRMMKALGYSEGYIYDHDTPQAYSGQSHMPKELQDEIFYHPKERGFERDLKKRIEYFKHLKSQM